MNDNEIIIEDFYYDGTGPAAYFWVGKVGRPSPDGVLLPYPFEGVFPESDDRNAPILKPFKGETVTLKLPDDLKVSDLKWISVWCRRFQVNFGDLEFDQTIEDMFTKPDLLVIPEGNDD